MGRIEGCTEIILLQHYGKEKNIYFLAIEFTWYVNKTGSVQTKMYTFRTLPVFLSLCKLPLLICMPAG